MTYGFQSRSSGDFVQIDDSYANFRVLQSGTATSNFWVTFPAQSVKPTIMVRWPAGKYMCLQDAETITTTRFWAFNPAGGANYVYSYVILIPMAGTVSADPYGLRVFDSSSVCVFDSGLSYMSLDQVNVLDFTLTTFQAIGGITRPRYVVYPVSYPTPPSGSRYINLNVLAPVGYFWDSPDGIYARYVCYGTWNSDTSVTYSVTYYNVAQFEAGYVLILMGSFRPAISGYF